ncbi:MAG: hypothetical protein IT260_12220 [Saprospiraceae bacterium]|nr:hypothetical protein [Saprospiraceae bacterium]
MKSKNAHLVPGHDGFLQPTSRIVGADYRDSSVQFSVAFIDYNGDGVFNQAGVDRMALTVYQDRELRINNGYGTACMKLKTVAPTFMVDSFAFEVAELAADGAWFKLRAKKPTQVPKPDLRIITALPDATFDTFLGKKLHLKDYLHQGKSVYVYFFNSRPLPYQLDKLNKIYEKYSDAVTIIGLSLPFSESLDEPYTEQLLKNMANPWHHAICDEATYALLQQDMSYFRGVWTDADGRIREISIGPNQLLAKLESAFGIR